MSWGNLTQLSIYGNTKNPDSGKENTGEKPKKAQKKARTQVVETLEGYVRMNSFFHKETRLALPGRGKFWQKMVENHRDWFTCLNPTRVQGKVWLLKVEFVPEATTELEKFILTDHKKPKGFK